MPISTKIALGKKTIFELGQNLYSLHNGIHFSLAPMTLAKLNKANIHRCVTVAIDTTSLCRLDTVDDIEGVVLSLHLHECCV